MSKPEKLLEEYLINVTNRIIQSCQPSIFSSSTVLQSLVLIGSHLKPNLRRKASDIDLVAIVNDPDIKNQESFKFCFFGNKFKNIDTESLTETIDLKFYTFESFKKELLHGTNTALFGLLNSYYLFYDITSSAQSVIKTANLRKNAIISLTKKELAALDFEEEVNNMAIYFTETHTVLNSETTTTQLTLLHLYFAEYLKEFLVQFLRLLYTQDIQTKKKQDELFDSHIWHLVVVNGSDATRLMNYKKYLFEPRLLQCILYFDEILNGEQSFSQKINIIFDEANKLFEKHFNRKLIIDPDYKFELKTYVSLA